MNIVLSQANWPVPCWERTLIEASHFLAHATSRGHSLGTSLGTHGTQQNKHINSQPQVAKQPEHFRKLQSAAHHKGMIQPALGSQKETTMRTFTQTLPADQSPTHGVSCKINHHINACAALASHSAPFRANRTLWPNLMPFGTATRPK